MVRGVVWTALLVLTACAPQTTSETTKDGTDDETDAPETGDSGTTTDTGDPLPPVGTTIDQVVLPLGETLHFAGDDYLAPWGVGDAARVTLVARPAFGDPQADVVDGRLTPDVPGTWTILNGDDGADIVVVDEGPTADTFLNYNYSPIAPLLAWDADTAWVASPPSNAVQRVDLVEGQLVAGPLIATGSWPTALARWGDLLLVSQTGRDSLGLVDPTLGRVIDAIPVGDEPSGLVVVGDAAWVALAGAGGGELVRVDLVNRTVSDRVTVGREAKAVAYDPVRKWVFVASQLSSNAHPEGPGDGPITGQPDIWIVDADTAEVVDTIDDVATILRGLLVDGDRLLVACSESRNDKGSIDADAHPHEHLVVEVDLDDLTQRTVKTGAPGKSTAFASPFTMLRDGDDLWITAAASQVVGRFDPDALTEDERVRVGHDPRGLAMLGDTLLTYAWLDETVSAVADGAVVSSVVVGRDPTPDDVREGQRIFNDGAFSRYGEFSCNNCHLDGVVDGLTWDLLLDGEVNTLPFRNIGGTGPFLWGGFLPTLFDFSREVLRLVGAQASGEQMALLNVYMQSVTAPPNPFAAPGGRLTAEGARGRLLFTGKAGCDACHAGPLFTVGETAPGKAVATTTDIPGLIGVYDSAPYGRDGRYHDLDAMVARAVDYVGVSLSADEVADLTAYVQQIPGDLLYVTGAHPLDGAGFVSFSSQVEIAFSGVLATGQEDHFTLEARSASGWATVPGDWVVSGRFARFDPTAEALDTERDYRVTVTSGVQSALGNRLLDDLELSFSTGAMPETDVSGVWEIAVPGTGSLEMGLIQSAGGQVSGARIDSGGELDFDNVRGHVAGTTLVLEPFVAVVTGFEVEVFTSQASLVDDDGDGYADRGSVQFETAFIDFDADLERVSLPDDATP